MNQDEIMNIVHLLLTVIGSAIVADGFATGTEWAQLAGGVTAIIGPAWSIYSHWNQKKVPETAKIAP